jgi:hypothetical protein
MDASQMPELPSVPDTDPSSAILDSFRIAIAKRLSESLPLTLEKAFSGVDYGKKGEDFTVALPRFRLPGKVDEIGKQVIDKVSLFSKMLTQMVTRTLFISLTVISSSNLMSGSNP